MFAPYPRVLVPLLVAGACTTQVGGSDFAPNVDGGERADFGARDAAPRADAAPLAGPCGEGDAHIETADGVCFEYFFQARSWDAAQDKCRSLHGDLARIDDSTTNGILASLVPIAFPKAWLRGSDSQAEGQWTWDGEAMSYTNWRSGEPNNGDGNENCMIIESDQGGRWDDRNCLDSFNFLCER